MTKRKESKRAVPRGTLAKAIEGSPEFRDILMGRDRDVEGRVAVPDVAKRNPEQPGPAKRASPTASERLRYRSLASELRPWIPTLQTLADSSHSDIGLRAAQTWASLYDLLLALDKAGRTS